MNETEVAAEVSQMQEKVELGWFLHVEPLLSRLLSPSRKDLGLGCLLRAP